MLEYFKQRIEDGDMDNQESSKITGGLKKNPHTFFIGFSGKKQSGKDTAAKFAKEILEQRGRKVEIVAFADPLKELCINLFGLERELVYGTHEDKETITHLAWENLPLEARITASGPLLRSGNMTIREVLQAFGTGVMRRFYSNVWAEAPFRRNWIGTDVVILSDIRFLNEIEVVEKYEGTIIRVVRNTGLLDTHASEIELDSYPFRHIIENNGSLDDLYNKVYDCLEEI